MKDSFEQSEPHRGSGAPPAIEGGSLEILSTIWRGRHTVIAAVCVTLAIGAYYVFAAATPLYRASAVVKLEPHQDTIVDLQSVVTGISGETTEVNSEVEVLRARGLMGQVVDELGLIDDPEFNSSLRQPGLKSRLRRLAASFVGSSAARVLSEDAVRDRVVSALIERMTVRPVPMSLVFRVTATSADPEKAARLADTITRTYVANQVAQKFDATEQATIWLTDRVADLQAELEAAEAAVADFSASTELISAEALAGLERQLKDLRDRVAQLRADRDAASLRRAAFKDAATWDAKARASGDPQLAAQLERAGTANRRATLIDMAGARLDLTVDRTDRQIAALRERETALKAQIALQGKDLIALQQLNREAEATRLLYEHFLARLKETSVQQGIQRADSRILSQAVVPLSASTPRESLVLSIAAIIGAVLGVAAVLLREMRSTTFRTPQELEDFTGLAVLGQVPVIPARGRKRVIGYLGQKPASAAAESVRNLRTSVMLSNVDTPPQVIVSTSSIPGEGKTTMSLALAHNLLGLGRSVLVIEGDIRRRTFPQYFGGLPSKGLVSVLSGDIQMEEAIFQPEGFGADILVGEQANANAADIFASHRFRGLIASARARYDTIIIDTPPVLVVPDARIIAQSADALLLTVQWDRTTRPQVAEALRLLNTGSRGVTGVVMSQINPKRIRRYGYGERNGAFASYGARYYAN